MVQGYIAPVGKVSFLLLGLDGLTEFASQIFSLSEHALPIVRDSGVNLGYQKLARQRIWIQINYFQTTKMGKCCGTEE
jgi:hypothetical protein